MKNLVIALTVIYSNLNGFNLFGQKTFFNAESKAEKCQILSEWVNDPKITEIQNDLGSYGIEFEYKDKVKYHNLVFLKYFGKPIWEFDPMDFEAVYSTVITKHCERSVKNEINSTFRYGSEDFHRYPGADMQLGFLKNNGFPVDHIKQLVDEPGQRLLTIEDDDFNGSYEGSGKVNGEKYHVRIEIGPTNQPLVKIGRFILLESELSKKPEREFMLYGQITTTGDAIIFLSGEGRGYYINFKKKGKYSASSSLASKMEKVENGADMPTDLFEHFIRFGSPAANRPSYKGFLSKNEKTYNLNYQLRAPYDRLATFLTNQTITTTLNVQPGFDAESAFYALGKLANYGNSLRPFPRLTMINVIPEYLIGSAREPMFQIFLERDKEGFVKDLQVKTLQAYEDAKIKFDERTAEAVAKKELLEMAKREKEEEEWRRYLATVSISDNELIDFDKLKLQKEEIQNLKYIYYGAFDIYRVDKESINPVFFLLYHYALNDAYNEILTSDPRFSEIELKVQDQVRYLLAEAKYEDEIRYNFHKSLLYVSNNPIVFLIFSFQKFAQLRETEESKIILDELIPLLDPREKAYSRFSENLYRFMRGEAPLK